jgi:hypothetical protein
MKASTSRRIPLPADQVWEIAGRFNGLTEISSVTAASELIDGGRIRRVTGTSGGVLLERLKRFDDDARSFTYEITEVKGVELAYGVGYRGTVSILDDEPGKSCIWRYDAEFEPLSGVSAEEGRKAVANFVQDCIDGACRILGVETERPPTT